MVVGFPCVWIEAHRLGLTSYRANHIQSGMQVHIKQTFASVQACCFLQDYEMLALKHPNLERLVACYQTPEDEPESADLRSTVLWMVTEYHSVLLSDVSDLWEFMRLNEAQVAYICKQVRTFYLCCYRHLRCL